MSRSQTSFFICDNIVRRIVFPPLPGASRDTSIFQMNCINSVISNSEFLFGQSKILGFKRLLSSHNPNNNGTPYLSNYGISTELPSPVIIEGTTTQIDVYNPFKENVLIITSSSNSDTSIYEMFWVNEYANSDVAQSLGLVSQSVFPDPNA
jgi:hypothetical protein